MAARREAVHMGGRGKRMGCLVLSASLRAGPRAVWCGYRVPLSLTPAVSPQPRRCGVMNAVVQRTATGLHLATTQAATA